MNQSPLPGKENAVIGLSQMSSGTYRNNRKWVPHGREGLDYEKKG